MYQQFYGLSNQPFRITPDTEAFFEGESRGAILQGICYAVSQGEGIIKVVGEVGTGKTMLCRMLPLRLSAGIDWVYIAHPSLSPEHTLHAIAHELGLSLDEETDKLTVMRCLHTELLERHTQNRQVVVLVEEAQGMPLETLEEIRLLSNLETNESKLLQIVLFGQPELDDKLDQWSIRQLKERITHSLYLPPLAVEDTHAYLNFRLHVAGYRGPKIFTKRLASCVHKHSLGLTRRVNIIADKALMLAYSKGRHQLKRSDIKDAALDNQFSQPRPKAGSKLWPGLFAGISLIAFVSLYLSGENTLLDALYQHGLLAFQ